MGTEARQMLSTAQLAEVIDRPERTVRRWCETGYLDEAERDHPGAPWLIPLAFAAEFFSGKFKGDRLARDYNAERTEHFRRRSVRPERPDPHQMGIDFGGE